jgi:hypothetical protein
MRNQIQILVLLTAGLLPVNAAFARPELKADKVHMADNKKTQAYLADGLVVGGDSSIDDVIVRELRRAANSGFERIVVDLEGNRGGDAVAVQRPPYYQVAVSPEESRLTVTIWGRPKLAFNANKVHAAFKRSKVVENVELYPKVEDDSWTFALSLKSKHPVEVFELSNPVRLIFDIRTSGK